MRYVTNNIGSRSSQTTFYWDKEGKVQVVCGCFRGDLNEFKEKVSKVHLGTIHLDVYLKQIEVVEYLIKNTI